MDKDLSCGWKAYIHSISGLVPFCWVDNKAAVFCDTDCAL